MKHEVFTLVRWDADENKVFDWKEPRYNIEIDENGVEREVQDHLYAKTVYIGKFDTIENYIEVDEPTTEEE